MLLKQRESNMNRTQDCQDHSQIWLPAIDHQQTSNAVRLPDLAPGFGCNGPFAIREILRTTPIIQQAMCNMPVNGAMILMRKMEHAICHA